MVSVPAFIKLARSFPETIEQPHFEKTSFRVKKKIFATLDAANGLLVVKLSDEDQSIFIAYNKNIIYPAKGAWGKQGWTIIVLKEIKKELLKAALNASYKLVATKKPKHLKS